MKGLASIGLMLAALQARAGIEPPLVSSPEEACSLTMAAYAEAYVPPLSTTYCDTIPESDSPQGVFVLALRSGRECDGICSDLMGWFAVRRSTGQARHWDVGEQRVGPPLGPDT